MKKSNLSESLAGLTASFAVSTAILGVMGKMFGFGEKTDKRDLLKGVADLIIDDYENTISSQGDEIRNLENKILELNKELEGIKNKKTSKKKK
ncbi:MAG: hypothetical protein ACOC5T_07330 [Elusimicrobiota bacterium]